MNLKEIYNFHCPRWEELPEKPLFNKEVVEYINGVLSPIIDEDGYLTTTMVQNYTKWGVIPAPEGRKYNKSQISVLLVVTIYKYVLNIDYVKKGVELLLRHMDLSFAYDAVCQSLERSIKETFSFLFDEEGNMKECKKIEENYVGLFAVSNAFVLKLLAHIVIESEGYKNIGGNNE